MRKITIHFKNNAVFTRDDVVAHSNQSDHLWVKYSDDTRAWYTYSNVVSIELGPEEA